MTQPAQPELPTHRCSHGINICECCKDTSCECHHCTRSRPAPAAPKFNSTDLLLLAHDEWKRREERKHKSDMASWELGFMEGFCTDKKWARGYIDKLRQSQQQEKQ